MLKKNKQFRKSMKALFEIQKFQPNFKEPNFISDNYREVCKDFSEKK